MFVPVSVDQPCVTDAKLTELVERVVRAYDQGVLQPRSAAVPITNWDLPSSVFFASIVATTIGYGKLMLNKSITNSSASLILAQQAQSHEYIMTHTAI